MTRPHPGTRNPACLTSIALAGALMLSAAPASEPPNLALQAKVAASSEFSADYAAMLISGQLGFTDILVIKRHHLTTSHVYTYHVDGFIPGGGLEVYSPATATMRQLVDAGPGEILDCDLSYDGKEVLFSWKQNGSPIRDVASSGTEHSLATPTENYQIFRVNLDGSALTQLTHDPSNNLSPRWLPDGGIVFTSDRRPAFAYCWVSSSPVLYRMERDGSRVLKISSSYLMDFTPCVLNDGRILYTRWEYVDRPAIPIQGLWTIRPDGTGLAGYFGNRVLEPATFMQAQAIPGTGKVICMLTSHGGDPRGAIAIIDPNHGSNAQQSIQNLTPELDIGHVDQGNGESLRNRGPYEAPFPIDPHHYLVSRAGAIQLRDFNNTNPPATVLAKPADGMGYYSPVPIQPRPMPMTMPIPNIPEDTPRGPPSTCPMCITDWNPWSNAARSNNSSSSRNWQKPPFPRCKAGRSASSSRWFPAVPPIPQKESGAMPMWRRTAPPTSRPRPTARFTF